MSFIAQGGQASNDTIPTHTLSSEQTARSSNADPSKYTNSTNHAASGANAPVDASHDTSSSNMALTINTRGGPPVQP
ncbi:hypothetical protein BDQ17DRAFT_1426587 [Cyathus striatus]|nr:hypothetical protein BDQ17DRAFT_1426587 [Cyathus striatus]